MKFNFGHGLFLGAAAFVVFIFYLVSQMLSQKIDLVAENYYEAGLEYQKQIDKTQFEKPEAFTVLQRGDSLVLNWNEETIHSDSLNIRFYRPSDKSKDFELSDAWKTKNFCVHDPRLDYGNWKLKLTWKNNEGTFSSNYSLFWQ